VVCLEAAALEDADAACFGQRPRFAHEPRFANAGVPRDAQHAAFLVQEGLQGFELRRAANGDRAKIALLWQAGHRVAFRQVDVRAWTRCRFNSGASIQTSHGRSAAQPARALVCGDASMAPGQVARTAAIACSKESPPRIK
jgi:hypothetical protein